MSKRMPARKNRMPISQAGGNTATVSLMMQVLRPQMAAAPRSMALYPHWGSAVAEVGGLFVMCVMPAIVAGLLRRIEGCVSREVRYFKWGARERESKGACRMAFAPSSGTRLRLKKKRPSVEGRFLKLRAWPLVRRASSAWSVAGIVRVITRGVRRFGHDVNGDHGAAVDLLAGGDALLGNRSRGSRTSGCISSA